MSAFIQLFARFLLASVFLANGVFKITDLSGTQKYMAHYGIPLTGVLVAGAVAVEILGGLSVLTGYKAKWGAVVLFLFLIPTTWVFHTEFSDRMQLIQLLKNLAIMGGLLLLTVHGPGKLSLE